MKWIILLGFVVAFCAGGVVGLRVRPPIVASSHEESWLSRELHLNPDQAEQVKKIWSDGVRATLREQDDRRKGLRKERDEAIAALVPAERKTAYQQVLDRYTMQMNQINQERSKAFEAAEQETKQLLTVDQRQKYEEILKNRDRGRGRRSETRPSAQAGPVSQANSATSQPSTRAVEP